MNKPTRFMPPSAGNTEESLKQLLLNLKYFEKIENDNSKLKNLLRQNQEMVKELFNDKKVLSEALSKSKFDVDDKDVKLKKMQKLNFVLTKKIQEIDKSNKILSKKYKEFYINSKKLYDQKKELEAEKLSLLDKVQSIEKINIDTNIEIKKRTDELKQFFALKHEKEIEKIKNLSKFKSRNILTEYENIKIELNRRVVLEKDKFNRLEEKVKVLLLYLSKLQKENSTLKEINKDVILKLDYLSNKSLANRELLMQKIGILKDDFKDKVNTIGKMQIEKEIEYKTKIDSLTKDLKKYYAELKDTKKKYYKREEQLREKFLDILKSEYEDNEKINIKKN